MQGWSDRLGYQIIKLKWKCKLMACLNGAWYVPRKLFDNLHSSFHIFGIIGIVAFSKLFTNQILPDLPQIARNAAVLTSYLCLKGLLCYVLAE